MTSAATPTPIRMDAFLRYGDRAASTRQRLLQYGPSLASGNISMVPYALLSNEYVAAVGSSAKPSRLRILSDYGRRVGQLVSARNADLVWTHFEALPFVPGPVERALTSADVPVILDYDDAWFHRYDQHSSRGVRRLLGGKIAGLMKGAALVACGNDYIRDYADAQGARTILLPTVLDTSIYRPSSTKPDGLPIIGWMGSPTTSAHLQPVLPILQRIVEDGLARVLIVGSNLDHEVGRWADLRSWDADREVADLQTFDVGIMPLDDSVFARGKCGYKLIQYMACGTATVTTPVGANATIVRNGETGLHARNSDEWNLSLRTLLGEPNRRSRMGVAGRSDAVELWSLATHAPRFVEAIRSVAAS